MIALIALSWADPVDHHTAQARQFVKRGWYDDAAAEVEAGLQLAGGTTDFDLNWLGAQIHYQRVDIDRALPFADRAVENAPEENARERATAFRDYLKNTFGWVQIRGPREGLTSRLQLESSSIVFDTDLKRLINQKSLELREPTRLPVRVALPAGEYLVNGAAVRVEAGSSSIVALQLNQLGEKGLAALQVTRFDVAAGMSVVLGDRVSNLHPGGAFELSLTQPVGPILIAGLASYDVRTYATVGGGEVFDPWSFGGGLRVSRELVVGGPLAIRPGIGARYALLPGIQLDCPDASLQCGEPGSVEPLMRVYAVGHAVVPFAELDVQFREAGRTTAFGIGVRAVGEYWAGRIPAGEATLPGGTESFGYTSSPSAFSAGGIRLLANVSIAF